MANDDFIVFYAWQSDLPNRDNRNFIESALESALKNLSKAGSIEKSPRLDKDTKGVPGIPDIANTILKKIQRADCFLCDVSFVGQITCEGDEERDLLPNPNVMLELGYALAEIGWERIILVLNKVTGDEDHLPFDLRNRRWPILYEMDSNFDDDERGKVKQLLVKRIQSAVESVAKLPEREKRGTTEERIRALEDMVGRLSGIVTQYTTIANLVAGLQQVTGKHKTINQETDLSCEKIRKTLVKDVLKGKFENVTVQQGMFVIAVCPSTFSSKLPLFKAENEKMLRKELRPLYASGWDHRRYGKKFITFSKWGDNVDAVTEIRDNGTIRAVGHDVMAVSAKHLNEKTPKGVLYIPSIAFEKSVIEAVSHYLKALKSLGIKGPWYVALGITNLKKSRLAVGASFTFGGRVFEGDEIMPPVVEIPAEADLGDPQNIARALRPAFDYIWREHNYPQSVNYSETGEWVGH